MNSCHAHLPPVDLDRISAVSILSGEHQVILQVLTCVERIADAAEAHGAIPVVEASQAIEVLRTFADRCHHGKEETLLFPALEAKVPGFGPTAVMRDEHVIGRAHIADMATGIATGDVVGYVRSARDYVGLLRAHIDKEDNILFPMAQDMLTPAEDAALLDGYRAVEHDDMGDGTHQRLLAIADRLAVTYGVRRASADARTMTLLTAVCGCHKD